MARRLHPLAAFAVIALLAMGFMAWKAKHPSPTADAASARAAQPAPASPATGSATQPDAAAVPLAQGDPSVRANLLLESRFVLGGSVNGDAVTQALSPEHFQQTAELMAAASRDNPGLSARNAAIRDAMAKTLASIDADARLASLECSERLCVMEVHPAGDAANDEYAGKLLEALGNRYGESLVLVTMPVESGGGTFYRHFFTLGSGLRSVRGSAP